MTCCVTPSQLRPDADRVSLFDYLTWNGDDAVLLKISFCHDFMCGGGIATFTMELPPDAARLMSRSWDARREHWEKRKLKNYTSLIFRWLLSSVGEFSAAGIDMCDIVRCRDVTLIPHRRDVHLPTGFTPMSRDLVSDVHDGLTMFDLAAKLSLDTTLMQALPAYRIFANPQPESE